MRRLATATLAGLTVFGLVNGLAASMEVSGGETLGSGNVVTAACDGAITMAYGLSTGANHQVIEITFSGVAAACDGLDYHLDVLGGTSGVLTSVTDSVTLDVDTFTVDIVDQAAADVAGVNITITG
jgi:hypothetical protein